MNEIMGIERFCILESSIVNYNRHNAIFLYGYSLKIQILLASGLNPKLFRIYKLKIPKLLAKYWLSIVQIYPVRFPPESTECGLQLQLQ